MASINFSEDDPSAGYTFPMTPGFSQGDQTYANQTAAREEYYKNYPAQAPTFTAPQQAGLDQILKQNTVTPAQPTAPSRPMAPAAGADYQTIIRQWQQSHSASEPLDPLIAELTRNGINASAFMYGATPSGNEITINGQKYKVKTGDNANWYDPSVGEGPASSYMGAFSDPSTQYMEQYYKSLLDQLTGQNSAMQQQRAALQARMPDIQASTQRLIDTLSVRASKLQGPAYTGSEQEVLRTQALDPIERDRSARKQQALQNIGSRGFDPTSGIAQELLNNVDSVYDKQRAGAQTDLAYRTINEQRAREQEAQQLLAMIPQIQRAGATGDLQFLTQLDQAVTSPLFQGTGLVSQLQQLPSQALRDANMTMGLSPTTGQAYNQASQQQQQSQANNAAFWEWFFSQFG